MHPHTPYINQCKSTLGVDPQYGIHTFPDNKFEYI